MKPWNIFGGIIVSICVIAFGIHQLTRAEATTGDNTIQNTDTVGLPFKGNKVSITRASDSSIEDLVMLTKDSETKIIALRLGFRKLLSVNPEGDIFLKDGEIVGNDIEVYEAAEAAFLPDPATEIDKE